MDNEHFCQEESSSQRKQKKESRSSEDKDVLQVNFMNLSLNYLSLIKLNY